jgi:hypothetical protein
MIMDKKHPTVLPSLTEALDRVKHQGDTVVHGLASTWHSPELPGEENPHLVPRSEVPPAKKNDK